jgi:hypothetical protein
MSLTMVEHRTYESLKSPTTDDVLVLVRPEPDNRRPHLYCDASSRKYVVLPFEVGHAKLTVLVSRS